MLNKSEMKEQKPRKKISTAGADWKIALTVDRMNKYHRLIT